MLGGGKEKMGGERKNEVDERRLNVKLKPRLRKVKEGLLKDVRAENAVNLSKRTLKQNLKKQTPLTTPIFRLFPHPQSPFFPLLNSQKYQIKLLMLQFNSSNPNARMSLRRPHLPSAEENQTGLSKREQRKLEQTLKHFANPIIDPKPKKKRKPLQKQISLLGKGEGGGEGGECGVRGEDAQVLVETKQQSQLNATPTRQPAVETPKSPLLHRPLRKDPEHPPREDFLNPDYPLVEQQQNLLDFLLQYQCRQMEQSFLKEEEGFLGVDEQGEPLQVVSNAKSEELVRRINGLVGVFRKALDRRPLSKAHLSLSASISKAAE